MWGTLESAQGNDSDEAPSPALSAAPETLPCLQLPLRFPVLSIPVLGPHRGHSRLNAGRWCLPPTASVQLAALPAQQGGACRPCIGQDLLSEARERRTDRRQRREKRARGTRQWQPP